MDNKHLMNKWSNFCGIGAVISVIDFFIMINQEDASTGAKITAIILLFGIVFCIVCVSKAGSVAVFGVFAAGKVSK